MEELEALPSYKKFRLLILCFLVPKDSIVIIGSDSVTKRGKVPRLQFYHPPLTPILCPSPCHDKQHMSHWKIRIPGKLPLDSILYHKFRRDSFQWRIADMPYNIQVPEKVPASHQWKALEERACTWRRFRPHKDKPSIWIRDNIWHHNCCMVVYP